MAERSRSPVPRTEDQRLFQPAFPLVQAKLRLGQHGDEYEQEADRIAGAMMSGPVAEGITGPNSVKPAGGLLLRRVFPEAQPKLRLRAAEAEEEKKGENEKDEEEEQDKGKRVQTKGLSGQPSKLPRKLIDRMKSLFGRGRPLPDAARTYFEPRFGHDFSQVRVHDGAEAGELARELHAQAFTHGNDIFFGAGQYQPDTSPGRWLLAHELTHVVQQQPSPVPAALATSPLHYELNRQHEPGEHEAERAAQQLSNSRTFNGKIAVSLTPAPPNVIARRIAGQSFSNTSTSPRQLENTDERLAEWVVLNFQLDPSDELGGIRQRLANLDTLTREMVLEKVRLRISPSQWERLQTLLAQPVPTETEAPSSSTESAAARSSRITSQPQTGSRREIISPDAHFSASEFSDEMVPERGELRTGAAALLAPEIFAVRRLQRESPSAEISEARDQANTRVETRQAPEPREQEEAVAEETPVESLGEPASAEAISPSEEETSPEETSAPTEQATAASAPPISAVGAAPEEEASPAEQEEESGRTEERMAQARRSEAPEEADEFVDEGEGSEAALSPEVAAVAPAEEFVSTPEESEVPPEAEAPVEAEPADAISEAASSAEELPFATETEPSTIAPEVETASATPVPEAALETLTPPEPAEEQAASLETTAAAPAPELEGIPEEEGVETAAPPASGALLESGEQQAAMSMIAEDASSGAAAGAGASSGGGEAIPDPTPSEPPDLSQTNDPGQAMAGLHQLAPIQLQAALPQVSGAAARSVSAQRDELTSHPPQMPRPSGAPETHEAPVAQRVPPPSTTAFRQVERTPEGQSVRTPQPAPLPAPPPSPTQAVRTPAVTSDQQGELTANDAQRMQASISRLPISDSGLEVDAGPTPTLALEGNADPAQARQQQIQLERSMAEAHTQGLQDAAQPMGENEIFPTNVDPNETLTAQIPSGSNGAAGAEATTGAGGGAAVAGGNGAAAGGSEMDIAASVIAREQRGEEISNALSQGQSEVAARREEHQSQVTEERANADQEIAQLQEQNAAEQQRERSAAQQEVQQQRQQWTEEQRTLVDRNRAESDRVMRQNEQEIGREQDRANTESAGHIQEGNRRAEEERQGAEREAERQRREGERESESSGFFGWLADQATAFFNRIKEGIKAVFDAARRAVRAAIDAAKRLAVAAIERARQAVVGLIRIAGQALIAIGGVVLAGFPGLRDRFRNLIEEGVNRAEAVVNALADRLKEDVQRALNALGAVLDAALGLLERAYLAAVDVVGRVVQGAINFAKSVVQALAAFAALIKDIAANPIRWLRNLGASAWDGVRNHLWTAFKAAIQNWFNQKLEEVLGLGIAIWNFLRNGGIQLAQVGQMAWEALKSAIPTVLIQILIEKLVSLIILAAGAVMAIIEGLQAAWGTVSRILQAFEKFFAFLKAVKSGNAGQKFAQAIAAAAIAVIDFVANWLLRRLRRPAGRVAGRLRAIAQRIMQRLRSVARRVGGALRRVGRRIGRGFRRLRARARRRFGRRGGRRRDRRADQERRLRERQDRAFERARQLLGQRLRKWLPKIIVNGLLVLLKLRYRFKVLRIQESRNNFKIVAGFSPERELGNGQVLKPKEEVEQASASGSRFLFRGDDYYKAGPLGFEIGSKEAEEAEIQTPWEHVRKKQSEQTSRFVSFSITRRGTAKFTKKNRILKATLDALDALKNKGTIKIYTPDDVERLMLAHDKPKVRRLARSVKQDMEKNGEVLIEGLIPAEILKWST